MASGLFTDLLAPQRIMSPKSERRLADATDIVGYSAQSDEAGLSLPSLRYQRLLKTRSGRIRVLCQYRRQAALLIEERALNISIKTVTKF